jgi:4-hydroxy-tetrahydrodipicolinate synthase
MAHPFSPFCVALVTPFTAEGELAEGPVRTLVAHLKTQGVGAFLVSGSTGEQHSMTLEERSRLYRWVVDEADPGVPVYAGVAAVRTADAVFLAHAAEKAGVKGVMVGFPPYVKLTALDAQAYVDRVCGATGLPAIIYNNPLRTAFDLLPETLEAMVLQNPTIKAVKETGDPTRASRIKAILGKDFQIFSGNDRTIVAAWSRGFDGLTSVAGNLWPRELASVVEALEKGRTVEASSLLAPLAPLVASVIEPQIPGSLKYGMRFLGLPGGWCREPLGHLGPDLEQRIEKALSD